jgi:hypothetical protein
VLNNRSYWCCGNVCCTCNCTLCLSWPRIAGSTRVRPEVCDQFTDTSSLSSAQISTTQCPTRHITSRFSSSRPRTAVHVLHHYLARAVATVRANTHSQPFRAHSLRISQLTDPTPLSTLAPSCALHRTRVCVTHHQARPQPIVAHCGCVFISIAPTNMWRVARKLTRLPQHACFHQVLPRQVWLFFRKRTQKTTGSPMPLLLHREM